jgi:hypothetical protein
MHSFMGIAIAMLCVERSLAIALFAAPAASRALPPANTALRSNIVTSTLSCY